MCHLGPNTWQGCQLRHGSRDVPFVALLQDGGCLFDEFYFALKDGVDQPWGEASPDLGGPTGAQGCPSPAYVSSTGEHGPTSPGGEEPKAAKRLEGAPGRTAVHSWTHLSLTWASDMWVVPCLSISSRG